MSYLEEREGEIYFYEKSIQNQDYSIMRAMAVWAQEGLEDLSHVEGQEGRW